MTLKKGIEIDKRRKEKKKKGKPIETDNQKSLSYMGDRR